MLPASTVLANASSSGTRPPLQRLRRSLSWCLGLATLGAALAGCAAPEDEDAGAAEGAATVGGRWTSPVEPGVYDGDSGAIAITNWADRQVASAVVSSGGTFAACLSVTIDVTQRQALLEAPGCSFKLTPGTDESTMNVAGTLGKGDQATAFSQPFRRRKANALVGTYAADTAKIAIESSTDDRLTYSVTLDGKVIVAHGIAETRSLSGSNYSQGSIFQGDNGGCPIQITVLRSEREYTLSVGSLASPAQAGRCARLPVSLFPAK